MTATIFLILRILLSISLYAFILVLFYLLWKENWRQGIWLSRRKIPSISLTIQTIDSPARIRHFDTEEVTIGRESTCECRLDDENVSNHHARLKYHHTQWWLEDLGSTNGTLINNQPLSTPVVVISGDEINCGKHTLTIKISAESPGKLTLKNASKVNGDDND
jgi:pSer/pThr/pTyr-binding forkhead associated (FHA) protein